MTSEDVAAILEEIGVLLELKGENPFKSRAYYNAARTLESLTEPLDRLVAEQRLGDLKGIGEALQAKIAALVTDGRLPYYEDLKASLPPGLVDLLNIPGLGPKKIRKLHEHLSVDSAETLEAACLDGRVAALDGFGDKSAARILEGIRFRRQFGSRFRISTALAAADPILEALRAHPDVTRCSLAGSLRRSKEVIGDLDFVASSREAAEVLDHFTRLPGVQAVNARGDTKASVLLEHGLQADLRVVSDAEFPFALAYFTGSKEHNIVMRQRAIARGLRLNEYGLFPAGTPGTSQPASLKCHTEDDIYQELGLPFIPPELREDQGEFQAAETGELPRLLEWTELKGSLHNHSTWSDGRQSLEDIAEYAQELGLAYWAITDHSRSSVQAHGLDATRLREQRRAIHDLNRRLEDEGSDFRLLAGSEVDILKSGLDFPDDVLAELDIVVASLHVPSRDEAENTRRLIAAVQNPHVHILGHPTGRLLLERDAYPVNLRAVVDACAESGTWIELNASPARMDLDWRLWIHARRRGVRCVINCDAHRREHFAYLRLGAGVARKGWLTREDVMNTLPLAELQIALQARHPRHRGRTARPT